VHLALLLTPATDARTERRSVQRRIRRLKRRPNGPSVAVAAYAEAVLLYWDRSEGRCLDALRNATDLFRCISMEPSARACEARTGQLMGGEAGHALLRTALRWFRDQGAADPPALVRMLTPGLPEPLASG